MLVVPSRRVREHGSPSCGCSVSALETSPMGALLLDQGNSDAGVLVRRVEE